MSQVRPFSFQVTKLTKELKETKALFELADAAKNDLAEVDTSLPHLSTVV